MDGLKMEIYGLTTEYAAEPLAVESRAPRFGWKWRAKGEFFQESYRVLVSENPAVQIGDCWDSGEMKSGESVGIRYAGVPLKPRTRYYWRVISHGIESPVAAFETALWEPSLWWGRWIGMPMNFAGHTLLLRTAFEIPVGKKVLRARAYVAGLGCHVAYLNGARAGVEVLGPKVSSYDKRVYYNTYALDVRPGTNVFGLELGYGWLGNRMAFAQIFVDFADGSVLHLCTESGENWWAGCGAVTSNSIYGGERYDARLERAGWCTPGYAPGWDRGWMYSVGVPPLSGKLCAQQSEGMTVVSRFPGRSLVGDVFDIGQNISGWARIRVRGERGAKVRLRFAERLDESGRLNRLNLRSAANEDEYILKGDGEEEWAPSFTWHGFQYVEAKIEGKAELLSLEGEHVRSGVGKIGDFTCSDETLNRLHELAWRTESNNILGVLTDCPQRDERFGWLNDLTARIWQMANNFDYARFLPEFVRDITDAQKSDGSIPDTAPHFVGGRPADPVSGYLILALACYAMYGDEDCLRENYEAFQSWLGCLSTHVGEEGTLNCGVYGDWVPAAPFTKEGGECPFSAEVEPEFLSAAYFVWYHGMMERIARAIGREQDAKDYAEKREQLLAAFKRKYGDARGQTQTSVMLTAGARTDAETAAKELAEDVAGHGYHTTCGNQGYRHLLEWLGACGQAETAIALLKNPEYPGWGYMLACGATTVWERWEEDMKNLMHSYDHPMFASYDSFLYRHVAGLIVSSDARGADRFVIAPKFPAGIASARASVETVRGRAAVEWRRKGDKVTLTAEIPANTRAEFRLPVKAENKNGKFFFVFPIK